MKVCNILFLLFLICLSGCEKKHSSNDLLHVDVRQSYPDKQVILQDIAQINYIPLETTEDILLSSSSQIAYVSDNYIVAYNLSNGDIFIFSGDGRIYTYFNHRGGSGTEYNAIRSFMFDEENKEIYVFDRTPSPRFLVYSIDGIFKRTLIVPSNSLSAYNWDKEALLCYDDSGLLQGEAKINPYSLISKENGNTISELDFVFPERFGSRAVREVSTPDGGTGLLPIYLVVTNNKYDGNDFLIGDMDSDTIWHLTNKGNKEPLLVKTPSVHSMDIKRTLTPVLNTTEYLFLYYAILDFDKALNSGEYTASTLMYDKSSNEITDVTFINREFEGKHNITFEPVHTKKNIAISRLNSYDLTEAYKEKRLSGRLESIVSSLNEDDNNVLMVVYFE